MGGVLPQAPPLASRDPEGESVTPPEPRRGAGGPDSPAPASALILTVTALLILTVTALLILTVTAPLQTGAVIFLLKFIPPGGRFFRAPGLSLIASSYSAICRGSGFFTNRIS
jgi:hypothetical protein